MGLAEAPGKQQLEPLKAVKFLPRSAFTSLCERALARVECRHHRDQEKTDLNVALESLERLRHRRITALIIADRHAVTRSSERGEEGQVSSERGEEGQVG